MTEIDNIRAAFESEVSTYPLNLEVNANGNYEYLGTHNAWMAYKSAYAQGQRDLITAMGQPVAWKLSIPDESELGHWFAEERPSHLSSIALYKLPEGVQK